MENSHCFILKETCAESAKIIRNRLNKFSEFREIPLDEKQQVMFFELAAKESKACISQIGNPPQEKRYIGYAIIDACDGYSNVFPLHNRIGIDQDFTDELIELSKNTKKKILYSWQDHSTTGKAVAEAGTLIKTIRYDTHGPLYTIDGKEFEPKSRQKGFVKIYDACPDPKAILPVELHEYLTHELAEEFVIRRSKIILYVHNDIADINVLLKNIGTCP